MYNNDPTMKTKSLKPYLYLLGAVALTSLFSQCAGQGSVIAEFQGRTKLPQPAPFNGREKNNRALHETFDAEAFKDNMVFTDQGMFENYKSLFWLKSAADREKINQTLVKGQKYKIDYAGLRMPSLGLYPNIVRVQKVDNAPAP